MERIIVLSCVLCLSLGCAVLPTDVADKKQRCELSSDKKTLRIVDIADETNTYYSVSGVLISPILIPTTAIVSGSYVLVNNVYHYAEKKIKCNDEKVN